MDECKRNGVVAGIAAGLFVASAFGTPVQAQHDGHGVPPLRDDQVAIEYLAHAAFRIHTPGGVRVLVDPYASQIWLRYDFPKKVDADVVLITHNHYDHDGGISILAPVPWDSGTTVWRQPGRYRYGDVEFHGIRGMHASLPGDVGRLNTIWVLEVAGFRIVHLGDNGPVTPANVWALPRVDLLMIPAGHHDHPDVRKYVIMSEEEVGYTVDVLSPRVVIPMHYRIPGFPAEAPEGMGLLGDWLKRQPRVEHLETHVKVFSRAGLPQESTVMVFPPSPEVPH